MKRLWRWLRRLCGPRPRAFEVDMTEAGVRRCLADRRKERGE